MQRDEINYGRSSLHARHERVFRGVGFMCAVTSSKTPKRFAALYAAAFARSHSILLL